MGHFLICPTPILGRKVEDERKVKACDCITSTEYCSECLSTYCTCLNIILRKRHLNTKRSIIEKQPLRRDHEYSNLLSFHEKYYIRNAVSWLMCFPNDRRLSDSDLEDTIIYKSDYVDSSTSDDDNENCRKKTRLYNRL